MTCPENEGAFHGVTRDTSNGCKVTCSYCCVYFNQQRANLPLHRLLNEGTCMDRALEDGGQHAIRRTTLLQSSVKNSLSEYWGSESSAKLLQTPVCCKIPRERPCTSRWSDSFNSNAYSVTRLMIQYCFVCTKNVTNMNLYQPQEQRGVTVHKLPERVELFWGMSDGVSSDYSNYCTDARAYEHPCPIRI